jgi:hypothetical protein
MEGVKVSSIVGCKEGKFEGAAEGNSDGSSVTKIIDRATSNKVLIRSAQ